MILFFIALVIGLGVGIWILMTSYRHDEWGFLLVIICGFFLFTICVIGPANYYSAMSAMKEFESVRTTIESARARGNDWENAALQQKVIESNQWLASAQYWSSTIFEPFWPDEIMYLEPIE